MKVHKSHHTSLQEFEVISAIQLGISRQDRWVLSNCPNQLQKDGRKRRRRRRFPFSCVSLILRFWLWRRYSRFILARIFVKNSAKNARDRVRAAVSPSFPATAPSRAQITQVLAYLHLVFATSPLSVSLKQTTGTQARLTLESKAFFTFAPVIHSLLGWWQTNGAYPRSDLVGRTCLLKVKN